MHFLHYLRENIVKIRKNTRKLLIKHPTSGLCVPPTQESAPGKLGMLPAEADRAGIRMNTAHPIRIQYS